jgi:hypothetical protein
MQALKGRGHRWHFAACLVLLQTAGCACHEGFVLKGNLSIGCYKACCNSACGNGGTGHGGWSHSDSLSSAPEGDRVGNGWPRFHPVPTQNVLSPAPLQAPLPRVVAEPKNATVASPRAKSVIPPAEGDREPHDAAANGEGRAETPTERPAVAPQELPPLNQSTRYREDNAVDSRVVPASGDVHPGRERSILRIREPVRQSGSASARRR